MNLLAEHFDYPCPSKYPMTRRRAVQLWFNAITMVCNSSFFFYHSLSKESKEVQIKISSIKKEHVSFATVLKPFPISKQSSLCNYLIYERKAEGCFSY